MKTKGLILSLAASALLNLPSSYAQKFQSTTELTQVKNVKFELYPVKFSKTECKNCLDFKGKHLHQITKKPVVVLEGFHYQPFADKKLGIKLFLDEKTGKTLEKVTKKYLNTNLAVVHNGKVIMVPAVKSIIKGNSFELTFNDRKKFEAVFNSFKQ